MRTWIAAVSGIILTAGILQAQSGARIKELQIVPGASHNTIIARTGEMYFSEIKRFINKICGIKAVRRKRSKPNSP